MDFNSDDGCVCVGIDQSIFREEFPWSNNKGSSHICVHSNVGLAETDIAIRNKRMCDMIGYTDGWTVSCVQVHI